MLQEEGEWEGGREDEDSEAAVLGHFWRTP
jgi:hypothetical protein